MEHAKKIILALVFAIFVGFVAFVGVSALIIAFTPPTIVAPLPPEPDVDVGVVVEPFSDGQKLDLMLLSAGSGGLAACAGRFDNPDLIRVGGAVHDALSDIFKPHNGTGDAYERIGDAMYVVLRKSMMSGKIIASGTNPPTWMTTDTVQACDALRAHVEAIATKPNNVLGLPVGEPLKYLRLIDKGLTT